MTIERKSSDTLTKIELYKMTQDPQTISLKNTEDIIIDLAQWVLYTDINSAGNDIEILSMMDTEGKVYATNSSTFIASFTKALDFFEGESFSKIQVIHGQSKSGRNYVDCSIIG